MALLAWPMCDEESSRELAMRTACDEEFCTKFDKLATGKPQRGVTTGFHPISIQGDPELVGHWRTDATTRLLPDEKGMY